MLPAPGPFGHSLQLHVRIVEATLSQQGSQPPGAVRRVLRQAQAMGGLGDGRSAEDQFINFTRVPNSFRSFEEIHDQRDRVLLRQLFGLPRPIGCAQLIDCTMRRALTEAGAA